MILYDVGSKLCIWGARSFSMAELSDDKASDAVLQRIATFFDSVGGWFVSKSITWNHKCCAPLSFSTGKRGFRYIVNAEVVEKQNFGAWVNETDRRTVDQAHLPAK